MHSNDPPVDPPPPSDPTPGGPIDVQLLALVVVLAIGAAVIVLTYRNPALGAAITVGIAVMGALLAILKPGGNSGG